jgi:hypothetical protein
MISIKLGSKRDEVTGGWRKLHNEELHNLYSSPSIIRMIKSREDEIGREYSMNGGEKECLYCISEKVRINH